MKELIKSKNPEQWYNFLCYMGPVPLDVTRKKLIRLLEDGAEIKKILYGKFNEKYSYFQFQLDCDTITLLIPWVE